jgi:hypothetical protein
MSPAAVIVILNGAIVASVPPPQLLFGHVMAPLAPVITRFTARAVLAGDTITLTRGARTCVFRIGSEAYSCDGVAAALPVAPFGRNGTAYVPLAEVVRAFGGAMEYDPHSAVAALDMPPDTELKTPAPFDPAAPSATPTTVFTPSPAPAPPATAVPAGAATPLPRRTAIPAIPSRVPGG